MMGRLGLGQARCRTLIDGRTHVFGPAHADGEGGSCRMDGLAGNVRNPPARGNTTRETRKEKDVGMGA